MILKQRSMSVVRLVLAFALVGGLLVQTIPASASGNTVDLSVTLDQPAGDATAGLSWSYDVTVANAGPDASTGYTVSFDAITGTSLSSASAGCVDNTTTIDCTSTGLLSGYDETFTITLDVSPSYADNTSLDAHVAITDTNGDTNSSESSSDDATTTVQAISDLGFEHSASPAGTLAEPWIAGQDVTLTAVVTNYGPSDAPDTTVTIGIPSGAEYVGDDSGCSENLGVVTCTDGSLAPSGVRTVNVTAHVPSDIAEAAVLGPSNAYVQTTGDEGVEPAHDNNGALSAHVHRIANLGIVKTGPDGVEPSVVAGNPDGFDYTITVATAGPSDTGFVVTDTLAAGLTYVDSLSDPACDLLLGDIKCGDSLTADADPVNYTIHVLVDPSVAGGSILENDASVAVPDDGTEDPDPSNNSTTSQEGGTVSTSITALADLGLDVSASTDDFVAGDPAGVDFTYTVSTDGPSDNVGGFSISDTLPDGFTFQSVGSSAACSAVGQAVTCEDTNDFAHDDDDRTFTVHATIASSVLPGTYNDGATVSSLGTTDPIGANDMDDAGVTVITRADLRTTLAAASGSHIAGDPAGFLITVRVDNDGYSDNTGGYAVSVPLPTGFTRASGGCAGTATVTCTNGTGLTDGSFDSYSFTVTIASNVLDSTPTITGTATSTGTIDPNAGNDADGDVVTVITRADMQAVSKTASLTTIRANDDASFNTTVFTIVVQNNGYSDAQSVSLTDTLPSQFESAKYCIGVACTPVTTYASPVSLGTMTAGASATVRIAAVADDTLRGGPITVANTATVGSTTVDPVSPNNSATSGNVRIETVPNPPTAVTAFAGNESAVVTWTAPVVDGGSSLTSYTVTLHPAPGGANPGPFTGLPVTSPLQLNIGTDGAPAITNGKAYYFTVQAVNIVGSSDPSANSNTITPSQDLSAEIFSSGNQLQQTGEGMPSSTDKIIAKQSSNSNGFPSGSIGTIEEILSAPNAYLNPSTFCGGLPCVGGEIVVTKVNDFATGRFLIDIWVAKGVATGTGAKDVYFDPTPGSTVYTTDTIKVAACPKNFSGTNANIPACIVKLIRKPALNPDLLVQISVRHDLTDPATALRK